MFTRSSVVGLLALVNCVCGLAVTPTPAQTPFYNSTTLTTSPVPSQTAAACCFVVLDTIYENWWQEVTTSTHYSVVNLTSVTTLVTPYPTTTLTNFETHVYTTNATFHFDVNVGQNPITMYTNDAPHPKETATVLNGNGNVTYISVYQNVTAVTTAGTTIHSPQAFWAYPSVRIITAEAVTNSAGNPVCATISGFPSIYTDYSFTNVGTTFNSLGEPVYTTFATYTTTMPEPTFTANSNVGNYYGNQTATQAGVVISLTMPFIYAPTRGAQGASGEPRPCDQRTGMENYGYPVQTLLDYLVNNPFYSSQYPGLASCLPGGPDVMQLQNCSQASPAFEIAGGDLTSSTIITVTPTGKIPSAQPVSIASPTLATPTEPVSTEQPASTSAASTSAASTSVLITTTLVASFPSENPSPSPSPSPSPNPQPSISQSQSPTPESTSNQESSTLAASPTPTAPVSPASQTDDQESPSPTSNSPTLSESQAPGQESPSPTPTTPVSPAPQTHDEETPSPASNSPTPSESQDPGQGSPSSSVSLDGPAAASFSPSASPGPSSALALSASDPAAAIAAAIASAIGASPITALPTVISGTSDFVISGETTIPVNPSISLSRSTTVISGVTNVIISAATTVRASQVLAPAELVGSTTQLSGTLEVIVAGAGPTTIPVGDAEGISGSTTVLAGSTFVVVETPETVPVVLGNPTGAGSGFASPSASASASASSGFGANSTTPLPFISAGSRYELQGCLVLSLSLALTACGVRLLF